LQQGIQWPLPKFKHKHPPPRTKKYHTTFNAHKQEMQARVKVYKLLAQFASTSAMAQHTPFAS
jgi:hypothetical protein